jgi:hypothetical protein
VTQLRIDAGDELPCLIADVLEHDGDDHPAHVL